MMIKNTILSILILNIAVIQNSRAGEEFFQKKASSTASTSSVIGYKKYAGYFNYYWDEAKGKLWLEIDKLDTEFLYQNALQTGVGSNDLGLDRGRLGDTKIVKFVKTGPKIYLIQSNYGFRANSDNSFERQAVEEAFAKSVLWGFDVSSEEAGKYLVDATAFFMQDVFNVAGSLKHDKEGAYKVDLSRSSMYLPYTKNFPDNSEFEALLTFTGEPTGPFVKTVVPTPDAISVRLHHSFVKLPESGYEPLVYDPRSSFNNIEFMDFATPIREPIVKRLTTRHRLKKKDPSAKVSEAVEPIIYYIDRGVPEPIRTALIEGASWWNQAYEAAGYKDAFQVKLLAEDADPMDVRYNLIQWVHRSTRGWSYGASVIDPRTGEIIKGKVTLGSLRVRQDFLIAEGLIAAYESGQPIKPEMEEMALARLRQLSAHEVGHTLGLAHNHTAHVNDRSSVMDYPHPLGILKENGEIDLSQAYTAGIGEWDKVSIAYGYSDFSSTSDANAERLKVINESFAKGLLYLTTQDARPIGTAHPLAHQWVNGKNTVDELYRVLKVREAGLKRFSEKNIREGLPMATLEEVLVPLYLYHRYQVHAAYKVLGGLTYTYALRGDGQTVTEMVPAEEQRKALDALLYTLQPEVLALPENVLKLIPPRPPGFEPTREMFPKRTGITFDALATVESTANLTLIGMLYPERIARLIEYHARDKNLPGFDEVVSKLLNTTWKAGRKSESYHSEIQRSVDKLVLQHLINIAVGKTISPQARAIAHLNLTELKDWIGTKIKSEKDRDQKAHFTLALAEICKYEEDPSVVIPIDFVDAPPGAPIGSYSLDLMDVACSE